VKVKNIILGRVSLKTKILYGVADLGIALQLSVVQFFMLFYLTDVAKISPGIAGSALLVSKLSWDMLNDPLFGYLSDRTKSRWGRRRPYMFFAAVPLGLSFWFLFSLRQGLTGAVAFFTVLGVFLLWDTFHSMICMGYYAITAEMTTDYNERTNINSIRMIFSVMGFIIGAAVTTMIVGIFRDGMGWTEKASWSAAGLIYGVIAVITVLITALTVRQKSVVGEEPSKLPIIPAIMKTLKNKPFIWLMGASSIVSTSFTLMTSMLPYFLIYQLGMEDKLPLIMLTMLGTLVIFLMPAKKLAEKIGKGPAYGAGLGLASIAMLGSFFLPKGPTPLIYVIAFFAGAGLAGQWAFPGSMVPDCVELDEKVTGERREGVYFGVWTFFGKIASALGIAMGGWSLKWFGYIEGIQQSTSSLQGIRLFFALIPTIGLIISVPLLIKYPITKKSHEALLKQLHYDDRK
jgi:GPH family glycoside/pentoside/hexuronide:cation symporter